MITQEHLKSVLHYNPETGLFTWLHTGTGRKKNLSAGATTKVGYRTIYIKPERHFSHRLAWLYVYGVWPENQIDHINGDKSDNRIHNLREATFIENLRNRGKYKNNTSGYKGVYFDKKRNSWFAKIFHEKKSIHLGTYNTPIEASKAYAVKAKELHGDFCNLK